MNSRIKELSKQAGDYVNETYTGPVRSKTPGKIWEDGHICWHTQFNEKFAQLIIAHATECVRDVLRDEDSDLTYPAATQVQNHIKQYFGVEY